MKIKYKYDGSNTFYIKDVETDETSHCKSKKKSRIRNALQQELYADKKEGLTIVFQAMDAAGKDGDISHVLQYLSPHGVYEAAFKSPSSTDLAHDFL